jgi:predicted MFS family arabinose efflux permease
MSGRRKRVLIYTASLLVAPLPLMPYVKGTHEFALALLACGAILSLSSFYVARGELKLKARGLLGNKLVASSLITLLFGIGILVGAIIYLVRSEFD